MPVDKKAIEAIKRSHDFDSTIAELFARQVRQDVDIDRDSMEKWVRERVNRQILELPDGWDL